MENVQLHYFYNSLILCASVSRCVFSVMLGVVCTLQKEVANGFLNVFPWINIFIYLLNDFLKKIPFVI